MDPTHEQQTKALLKAVRARIHNLTEQQAALTQTLAELEEIERQALAALQTLANAPAAQAGASLASTRRSP